MKILSLLSTVLDYQIFIDSNNFHTIQFKKKKFMQSRKSLNN